MDEATIKSMAAELAKGLKTPEDLNQMTAIFKKFMIETALNTELSEHLGYESINLRMDLMHVMVLAPKQF
ncbi:transposase [Acinetobacter pittii]|nr:transposase [Acinetobacter pittii]